ncbi:MAG: tetratricopeptide repeat protein [Deltaproteobacteria bacterium]|nr:tetratricopeptide repeat protein [Deltaproteobacteria bacterium]
MRLARLPRLGVAMALSIVAACAPKPKESRLAKDAKIVHAENAPEKLFERGKAFHAVGDLTRAEQYYAAAMQGGYPEKKVLPLLLRVCVESNRYQVAIDYAEPILRKNPGDHKLRLVIASLYSAVGQQSKARAQYERVVAEHPDDATAHFALAVLLRDEFGDAAGADKHFREYLRVAPDGPHAEEAKGSLLKDVSSLPTVPSMKTIPVAAAASSSAPTPLPPKPAPPAALPTPEKPATKPQKIP